MGKKKTCLIEKDKYLLSTARVKNYYVHKFMYTIFSDIIAKLCYILIYYLFFTYIRNLVFALFWFVCLVWVVLVWFDLVGLVCLVLLLNPVLPRSWDCIS